MVYEEVLSQSVLTVHKSIKTLLLNTLQYLKIVNEVSFMQKLLKHTKSLMLMYMYSKNGFERENLEGKTCGGNEWQKLLSQVDRLKGQEINLSYNEMWWESYKQKFICCFTTYVMFECCFLFSFGSFLSLFDLIAYVCLCFELWAETLYNNSLFFHWNSANSSSSYALVFDIFFTVGTMKQNS